MEPDDAPLGEIELISDEHGVAVIGDPATVELFLASEGLDSKELGLPRLSKALNAGGALAQGGSEIAANAGRWVKLTEESAQKLKRFKLMKGSSPGTARTVLTQNGKSKGFLELVKTPGSIAGNPAVLAGVGGIMAQLAMQQAMDEITDYLETIDKKLDSVLRMQLNQVLAEMDAVDLAIQEAMTVREHVGRVSEVAWSKVQTTSQSILKTQALVVRQLRDLASELEKKQKVGELTDATKETEADVRKWLAVLARCVQLHDAVAVLELDRVLDSAPDELDRYRMGLKAARESRLALLASATGDVLERMNTVVEIANAKVLRHPSASPALALTGNRVAIGVIEFHETVGIDASVQLAEGKEWALAVAEVKDKALDAGGDGYDAAKRFGNETYDRARTATSRVSAQVSERISRWRKR